MANKFLNGIDVTSTGSFTGQVTIPETPTADAHAASKKYVDDQITTGVDVAKRIEISVKNISGGELTKGTVVHAAPSASPPSGNVVEVIAADYDAEANMPAIGILNETLADDTEGVAVMMGAVSGIDTDDFTAGDELYVGADGALTNTKPQTAGQLIQKIAVCVKSHASNGLIKVFGAGRSNDVPLPLYIDNTNQRLGIGVTGPTKTLHVVSAAEAALFQGTATWGTGIQIDATATGGRNFQIQSSADAAGEGGGKFLIVDRDATGTPTRLSIDSAGKVGIGTTSPGAKLEINVASGDGILIKSADVATLKFKGSGSVSNWGFASTNLTAGDFGLYESNSAGGDPILAGTPRIMLKAGGNVGIGTTSPTAPLDVLGVRAGRDWAINDRAVIRLDSNGVSKPSDILFGHTEAANETSWTGAYWSLSSRGSIDSNRFHFYRAGGNPTGNAEAILMTLDPNLRVGIGTTSPGEKLEINTAAESAIMLRARYNANYYTDYGSNQLNFTGSNQSFSIKNNGTSALFINSASNVGIGTTLPDFKLDVDGTLGVSDLPFNTDSVSVLVADETIGADLVTNGDFATNTDWTEQGGAAAWSISNGKANCVVNSSTRYFEQPNVLPLTGAGNTYKVVYTISGITQGQFQINIGGYGATPGRTTNGTYAETFTTASTSSNNRIYLQSSPNTIGSIDNISVQLVTSASNQIQKRELGTGAFGPTPVGAYLPLTAGSGSPLTGDLYIEEDSLYLLNASNNYWRVQNNSSGKLTFKQGTTQRGIWSSGELQLANNLIVDNKIGVGTTNPQAFTKVDVRSGYADGDAAIAAYGYNGVGGYAISGHAYAIDNTHAGSATGLRGISNGGRSVSGSVNIGGYFTAQGSESNYALITDSGNVGIGTTSPTEKLDVAGNIKIQAALLSNQDNTDVDTGTETVANVAIATYTAAFFDFVVKKGTNVRSGTVYACHDGTNVEFTETSTNDLGDTSDVTLSVDISGTNMRLVATVTSDDWSVKSLIRAI